jgi:hypothetical protein
VWGGRGAPRRAPRPPLELSRCSADPGRVGQRSSGRVSVDSLITHMARSTSQNQLFTTIEVQPTYRWIALRRSVL